MVQRRGGFSRDVGATVAATIAGSMPVFLLGGMAVQIRDSLHFGAGTLGILATCYYIGAGLASIPLSRVVEGLGALRTMRAACGATAVLLLLVAALARSWPVLAVLLVPSGMSSAAVQPAANVFLARRIPPERQGFAFGVKQAAVPLSTALGGLAVPVVALTAGWRWAFVVAAAWAALTAATLPRPTTSLAERRATRLRVPVPRAELAPLLVLTAGFALGVATATALTAFLVSSAVDGGMPHGIAGLLAGFGGAAAALSRVITGLRADRRGRAHLPVVAGMLTAGAVGYVLLAVVSARDLPWLYLLAVPIVFAAGWGWNGLFNFIVVRTHATYPARATAVTQTGGRFGGVLGPFLFGMIVSRSSYAAAWGAAAIAAVGAAAVMLLGRRLLIASRNREQVPVPAATTQR